MELVVCPGLCTPIKCNNNNNNGSLNLLSLTVVIGELIFLNNPDVSITCTCTPVNLYTDTHSSALSPPLLNTCVMYTYNQAIVTTFGLCIHTTGQLQITIILCHDCWHWEKRFFFRIVQTFKIKMYNTSGMWGKVDLGTPCVRLKEVWNC